MKKIGRPESSKSKDQDMPVVLILERTMDVPEDWTDDMIVQAASIAVATSTWNPATITKQYRMGNRIGVTVLMKP